MLHTLLRGLVCLLAVCCYSCSRAHAQLFGSQAKWQDYCKDEYQSKSCTAKELCGCKQWWDIRCNVQCADKHSCLAQKQTCIRDARVIKDACEDACARFDFPCKRACRSTAINPYPAPQPQAAWQIVHNASDTTFVEDANSTGYFRAIGRGFRFDLSKMTELMALGHNRPTALAQLTDITFESGIDQRVVFQPQNMSAVGSQHIARFLFTTHVTSTGADISSDYVEIGSNRFAGNGGMGSITSWTDIATGGQENRWSSHNVVSFFSGVDFELQWVSDVMTLSVDGGAVSHVLFDAARFNGLPIHLLALAACVGNHCAPYSEFVYFQHEKH